MDGPEEGVEQPQGGQLFLLLRLGPCLTQRPQVLGVDAHSTPKPREREHPWGAAQTQLRPRVPETHSGWERGQGPHTLTSVTCARTWLTSCSHSGSSKHSRSSRVGKAFWSSTQAWAWGATGASVHRPRARGATGSPHGPRAPAPGPRACHGSCGRSHHLGPLLRQGQWGQCPARSPAQRHPPAASRAPIPPTQACLSARPPGTARS